MAPTQKKKFKTVTEYFAALPPKSRKMLKEMRAIIRQVIPQAEEAISYNIPAFKSGNVIVWYAAHQEHIGFYPTSTPIRVFKDELKNYKPSKGAIQFPIEKPIPKKLVQKILKFRMSQLLEKQKK